MRSGFSKLIGSERLNTGGPAALLAVVLTLAVACSGSSSTAGSTTGAAGSCTPTGTITIGTAEPPQTFDPIQAGNSTVDENAVQMYDTLVQWSAGPNTKLEPKLAKSWTVSSDGLTYVFQLRNDATFHDGTPLTASDVAFTLDRIKLLNTGVASEMTSYASSEATSPVELKVKLSQPYAPYLGALSRAYVLNSKLIKQNAGADNGQAWLANHDAGSGPYVLDLYTPGQSSQFRSYRKYWNGWCGGHVDKVVYRYIKEAATQREALNRGEINIAMNIDPTDYASFKSRPGFNVDAATSLVQYYIFFNTSSGPTANKLVRQAISYAYDYQSHIKEILLGNGSVAGGPLPSVMGCYDDTVTKPTYDLQKAKALLSQAGYTHLELGMEYLPVLSEEKNSFAMFQSSLAQIGVTLKPIGTTFPAYMDMLKSAQTTPDLGAVYAFPMFPDANEVLYINFDSKFIGKGYNYGRYKNPNVDQLVEEAQKISDPTRRCDLYKQAQQLIANDYVAINISNPKYVVVLGPGVKGYVYNTAHHFLETFYDLSLGK